MSWPWEHNVYVIRASMVAVGVFVLTGALLSAGCWAKDPCGDGFVLQSGNTCQAALLPADAAPESGADVTPGDASAALEGGEAGDAAPAAPAPSSFGKTCGAMTDCGGDAPICGAPQLPYCTQINCQPGEANAGSCPADYTCFTAPGYPSACLRN